MLRYLGRAKGYYIPLGMECITLHARAILVVKPMLNDRT